MNKREFLLSASATMSVAGQTIGSATAETHKSVERDGTVFQWYHQGNKLFGKLSAPTDGWFAVGFNGGQSLRGTYFVIAAVSSVPINAKEHIALVPQHKRLGELGWDETLVPLESSFSNGRSEISFSVVARPDPPHGVALNPGAQTHMMLAWSRDVDFDHHSAWREHLDITL